MVRPRKLTKTGQGQVFSQLIIVYTAIIRNTVFVFLSGAMIVSSPLSSLLTESDCWIHPGFVDKENKKLGTKDCQITIIAGNVAKLFKMNIEQN